MLFCVAFFSYQIKKNVPIEASRRLATQKMIQYSILGIIKKGSSDDQAKHAAVKMNSCEHGYPIKCHPYDRGFASFVVCVARHPFFAHLFSFDRRSRQPNKRHFAFPKCLISEPWSICSAQNKS